MASHCCPRCKAEIMRTAADCAGCGKPIAPLPWSVRLSGLGRRAPDAQVLDYARTVFPIRVGILVSFWGIAALMGGWGLWMVNGKMEAIGDLQQQVREDVRGDSVPARVRDDAIGLLEIQDGLLKIIKGACAALLGLGVMGIGAEVASLDLTRRLLRTGTNAEE